MRRMRMTSWQSNLVGCAIVIFLALLSWLTLLPGTPKIYAPLNVAVLEPAFLLDDFVNDTDVAVYAACAVVPLFFCIWCRTVLRGRTILPTRSIVLLVISLLMSAAWLGLGYGYGIEYQGAAYVVGVTVVSAVLWAALVGLAVLAARRPSVRYNLGFHAALFAWLAWYAFPYLGELP